MVYIRNKGISLIEALQAEGKKTFTIEEARRVLDLPRPNIRILLSNLKRQKRVITLTRGLYSLWHPSERRWGLHPLPILDELMKFKKTPYYIGLLSAADYHGAAHQKPQLLQVVVPKQLHLRNLSALGLSFHVKKGFSAGGIEQVTTSSGYVFYSSPELTALDILYFQSPCGGFGNVCLVIRDLIPQMDTKRLKEIGEHYPVLACIQRLGYLLEYFKGNARLIKTLQKIIKKRDLVPISLSPSYPKKGSIQGNWKIVENAYVETEL